ncbi:MAG: hypothetical protein LBO74_05000 [Candidatus Symbiothrix sp.]|jgi:uncharacterized protein YjcR|nr:hypothetical protein [Candidatus Symbiothrix sp.]
MVKTTHAIFFRFETIVNNLVAKIDSEIIASRENIQNILKKMDEVFNEQKAATQDITKRINLVYNFQKANMNRLFQLITVYAELAACGITDGKKKERLKEDIDNLINPKS